MKTLGLKERKLDTRMKIELGGLVVKSKLHYLQNDHKDVILGALIEAYNKIQSHGGDQHLQYYKSIGANAFAKQADDDKENQKLQLRP